MTTRHRDLRMQSVIQAIAQYHPTFADEIQGCTPDEIATLQAVVGRPLPACYVEFLQLMGHSTGPLVLYKDSDFSVDAVLEYLSDEELPRPPERYVLFGVAEDDPYAHFYLDCGTSEPQVVRFSTPETVEEFPKVIDALDWLASSLYEFVFARAFYHLHVSHFPHEGVLVEDADSPLQVAKAESVLSKLGFTRHPQSTSAVLFFERPTAKVVLERFVGSPWTLTLAAYDPRELAKVSDILGHHLQLLTPG